MRPNYNELNLNVDGCSKRNHVSAAAFSVYLSFSSNNLAEALSPKTCLRWCLDHGFHKVTIDSDFILIIHMVKGKINPFWQIKDDIKHIQYMKRDTTTYLLTNMMTGHRKTSTFFTEAMNLPSQITSTLKNDVVGKPNIRFRVKKDNFIFDLS
ncbi:hypothetical protein R3W88_000968 [Solanum pinnatisectum]|uniref:RNase H type-1 domain-containing protein n=1 Tax=Solanum pinnatisectum TaxID=50273 RepID=A0AAV9MH76_9SOLN|nr:hypothetical protein R3W88_000968 [Solanum pinnatisectum]